MFIYDILRPPNNINGNNNTLFSFRLLTNILLSGACFLNLIYPVVVNKI